MKKNEIVSVSLSAVELKDPYLLNAAKKTERYLLSLETGRLLAGFYENAGLKTSYVRYGGWENTLIGGHTLGHYLTAVSQAYAVGGSGDFGERVAAIVNGLFECQKAIGSGIVWGALPIEGGVEAQFDHVERGKTDIKREAWVPWYTLHKILAGLLDAYTLGKSDTALEVAKNLGDWVYGRTKTWDRRLQRKVLSVEYGGMNEALYRLAQITGDARYCAAARAFDEEPLFDEILSEKPNVLNGKHANTTIPKILGALMRYTVCGEERYLRVAQTFFRTVVEKHTYATGGNSEWEHFGRDGILDAERTNCNCETCNVYNMLKLARGLFCATGEKGYLDYYDNAFTNTVLSSQNPETGMTTYFQPMAGGFFKVFSGPYDKFWCCTGSGMENFTKLGDGIAYLCGNCLTVARYTACKIQIDGGSAEIDCDFPLRDRAVIRIGGAFALRLRIPDWCVGEPVLMRNGVPYGQIANGFFCAEVTDGDLLELTLPVSVTLAGLPDSRETFAFRYGGAVLSADLGAREMEESVTGVEVTIPKKRLLPSERIYFQNVAEVLRRPADFMVREGDRFRLVGGDVSYSFGLHYRRYRERYAIYFRFCEGDRAAERAEREPADVVQPGYGQYETDALHEMKECNSVGSTASGSCRYAKAGGFFSYDMIVDPAKRNRLRMTLRKDDNGRPLRVSVNGVTLFDERLLYTMGEETYVREIEISEAAIERCTRKEVGGREVSVVNVRFEGTRSCRSACICDFLGMYAE